MSFAMPRPLVDSLAASRRSVAAGTAPKAGSAQQVLGELHQPGIDAEQAELGAVEWEVGDARKLVTEPLVASGVDVVVKFVSGPEQPGQLTAPRRERYAGRTTKPSWVTPAKRQASWPGDRESQRPGPGPSLQAAAPTTCARRRTRPRRGRSRRVAGRARGRRIPCGPRADHSTISGLLVPSSAPPTARARGSGLRNACARPAWTS